MKKYYMARGKVIAFLVHVAATVLRNWCSKLHSLVQNAELVAWQTRIGVIWYDVRKLVEAD